MSESGSTSPSRRADVDPSQAADAVPERRQITVMFCDLVGSTALSRALDPEDLRDVLRAFQNVAAEVVERYGGSITRYMGDGILILFGYPVAHEDSPVRALHAAVEIVDGIKALDRCKRFGPNVSIKVRLGLATGLTVVGEVIGIGPSREESVVGETPNLAARMQGLAAPNEIVIAPSTRALVGERFECTSLGERALKGFSDPMEVWQVLGTRDPLVFRDDVDARHEPPLVNRERERALLTRLWQQSAAGNGQVVVISGEPGIGKSRLTRALRRIVRDSDGGWLRFQCFPYFANSALHPVATGLAQVAGLRRGDPQQTKLAKLGDAYGSLLADSRDVALARMAELFGMAASPRDLDFERSAPARKQLLMDTLTELPLAMAQRRSIAIVLEDAHWMDPTTGELLEQLAARIVDRRVLLVITHRADSRLRLSIPDASTQLELSRLHPLENQALVEGVTGDRHLPDDVVHAIVSRTDGVPLFVEELTRAVLASGGEMVRDAVPISLKDSLMARIDQLGDDKAFAQLASVMGQQFSRSLAQCVSQLTDEALDATLSRLVEAKIFSVSVDNAGRQDYSFRHALVRDAAYESQLRRRRESLHGRVADVLESEFSDLAQLNPELVAQHFTVANRLPEAVRRWIDAGRRAGERSDNREAVSHLKRGQAVLATLPEDDARNRLELELLNLLGPALIATEGGGANAVSDTYTRALEVCERLPESPQHFEAYWGWWRVSINHDVGQARAQQLLALAQTLNEPGLALQAHHCQWATLFHLGEHAGCLAHVREGLALYDEDAHRHQAALYGGHDARVCGEGEQALSLWLQGFEGQAQAPLQRALAWAESLKHVGSIAHARDYAVILALYQHDTEGVRQRAAELLDFAQHQRLPDYAIRAQFFDAWAQAQDGEAAQGLAGMRRAVDELSRIGTREDFPMFYELMVQVMAQLGRQREALALLHESFKESQRTGMRFWLAEQHRCRAELIRSSGSDGAERALVQALKVAHGQGAHAFALRAAVSLAQALDESGRRAKARTLLARHLQPFSADAVSRDVGIARSLLEHLGTS